MDTFIKNIPVIGQMALVGACTGVVSHLFSGSFENKVNYNSEIKGLKELSYVSEDMGEIVSELADLLVVCGTEKHLTMLIWYLTILTTIESHEVSLSMNYYASLLAGRIDEILEEITSLKIPVPGITFSVQESCDKIKGLVTDMIYNIQQSISVSVMSGGYE